MADLPSVIAAGAGAGAVMRTGRVVRYDVGSLTVDIGGGQLVSMPYLDGYLPILGDPVQCLGQRSVWFALGRSGQSPPDNQVVDGSFEQSALLTSPSAWGVYNDLSRGSGGTLLVRTNSVPPGFEIDGTQMLEVSCQSDGLNIAAAVYSQPIPVAPGQTWTAAASVYAAFQDIGPTLTLKLAWFADSTTTYPTTVAPDSVITFADPPPLQPWMLLRGASGGGGVVVPDGAAFMRVVLDSVVWNIAYAEWDKVICRQVN